MKNKKTYQKIWQEDVIYDETLCLIRDASGKKRGRLLFEPTEIICIKDATLSKVYDPSEYEVLQDEIIATENSSLPFFDEENLRGLHIPEGYDLSTYEAKEGRILFTEGPGIVLHQIAVTYRHKDTWKGKIPECKIDLLPCLKRRLENQEEFKMVCYGDSLMVGHNSSAKLRIKPMQPDFASAFVKEMMRIHKVRIKMVNNALGGMLSKAGSERIYEDVIEYHPDLVMISYGMNDASWKIPITEYISNMKYMIDAIKQDNPDCEIILISSMIANPDSIQHLGQESYYLPLEYLTQQYQGVVCLDMTNFTKYLFTRKRSVDFLANNINHPSDFLVRQFVSNLLTLIGD